MIAELFLLMLIISAVIMIGLAVYSLRFKTSPAALPFQVLMICCAYWSLNYVLDLSTIYLPLKIFWQESRFLVISFFPVIELWIILAYLDKLKWIRGWRVVALLIIPVITAVLAMTSQYHTLFRYNYTIDLTGPLPTLDFINGPWFQVLLTYSYVLLVVGWLLLIFVEESYRTYLAQRLLLLLALSLPVIPDILFEMGITPIPGINFAPALFWIAGLIYVLALFRYRFLDLVPIARSRVIDGMGIPMIVVNAEENVVDMNLSARSLLGGAFLSGVGMQVQDLVREWPEFSSFYKSDSPDQVELIKNDVEGTRTYSGSIDTIYSATGLPEGKIILLRDITKRKKAEYALHESEEKYRLIVENTHDIIFMMNAKGEYVYISPAVHDVLGYDVNDVIGKSYQSFIHPDDLQRVQENLNHIIFDNYRSSGSEYRVRHKSGEWRWNFTRGGIIRDGAGNFLYFIGAANDFTGRKLAEEALKQSHDNLEIQVQERTAQLTEVNRNLLEEIEVRMRAELDLKESEEKYRILLDESSDPVFSFYPDGTYRYVNRAFADGVGKPVDAIIGRKIWDVFPHEEAEQRFSALRWVFSTGESKVIEVRVPRSDGDRYYLTTIVPVKDDYGSVISALCTSKDITERKRTEEELRESEELFSTAFYSGPLMLTISEIDTGRYLEVNDTFTRVSGFSSDEAIGKTSIELGWISPEDRESLLQELHSTGRVAGKEIRLTKKNGEAVWSAFFGEIITISGNKRLLSLAEDITERKLAEEALRQSEEKFKFISENSPDHIIIQDCNLRYIWVLNPQLGITTEDMMGKTDYDILSKDDADKLTSVKRQVLETGVTITYTTSLVSPQGETEYFDGLFLPKYNNDGKIDGLMGYFRNITERKLAEDALHEAHMRTATILENIADTYYSLDNNWRFTLVNPAAEKAPFGRPASEMLGKVIWDLYPSLVGTYIHQHYNNALRNHTLEHYEGQSPLNGRWYDVFMQGRMAGVEVYMRDITDRKRAEEALRSSEERLGLALNVSQLGTWDLDLANHTAWRSLRHDQIFGYSSLLPEWTYEMFLEHVFPEDRDLVDHAFREAQSGQHDWEFECRIQRIDGENRWIWARGRIQYGLNGESLRMLGLVQDITERKQAEENLRNTLAEREVLLREVHHRVKNNLAGIISLIGLQTATLTDPSLISLLKDLETRIRSMALVHESLSRTKDLARINVARYTENLARELFGIYGAGANIPIRIDMGTITMPIETAIPCSLVMTEIITNSLKYAFPTTFSCKEQRGEPCTISISLQQDDNDYMLRIADNGIGIPEGTAVDRTHSLGLHLIQLIVRHQLRGTLEVNTTAGTAYTIRFPGPLHIGRNTNE